MAIVENEVVLGTRTKVWAFVHILPKAVIGEDCNICDHVFIEGDVKLGNRVTVKCGIYLWDGITIEDDVFLGPNVVFTNDKRPRSKKYLNTYPVSRLKQGSSIGANSTILPGITIGKYAMIGAGTVVTRNVPDHALVIGNPGRTVGWVCSCGEKLLSQLTGLICTCGKTYENNGDGEVKLTL